MLWERWRGEQGFSCWLYKCMWRVLNSRSNKGSLRKFSKRNNRVSLAFLKGHSAEWRTDWAEADRQKQNRKHLRGSLNCPHEKQEGWSKMTVVEIDNRRRCEKSSGRVAGALQRLKKQAEPPATIAKCWSPRLPCARLTGTSWAQQGHLFFQGAFSDPLPAPAWVFGVSIGPWIQSPYLE